MKMKKALLVMFFMVLPVAVPSQHVPDHTNPGSLLQRVERVERWAMSSRVMLTECIDELSIT
ncbi:MAG: hypothetical protein LBB27_03435, partial [Tannerellaceae bacterium]|nr:hypothetical protein [Tannerellaceae bacterium]